MRTVPLCGSYRRSSRRTIEDLPEPLGPTMPTRSPAATLKDRPLMRGAPAAGIGEADVVERDAGSGATRPSAPPLRGRADAAAGAPGAVTGSSSSALMPAAAAWPVMPWCSTVRRSRSGRKISVPAISTISSASRLISPWRTRYAPSASAAAAPRAQPRSVMPRVRTLVPSTRNVLSDSARALSASIRP